MVDEAALRQVVREFGPSILAYICNVPHPQVNAFIEGSYELDESQLRAFERLVQTLSGIRLEAAYQGLPSYILLSALAQDGAAYTRHPFNTWREEAGGQFPDLTSEDAVFRALAELAIDVYPTLLLLPHAPQSEHPMMLMQLARPTLNHLAIQRFESAVLDDQKLALLFPIKGEDAISIAGSFASSTGRGGSLQLATFSSLLIQAAYVLTRMRGGLEPVDLLDSLRYVLEIVRQSASGDSVQVPVFVGFSNIAIETAFPIDVPWGVIRSYNEAWSEFLPAHARPPTLSGENVTLGFVLETSYPYELNISHQDAVSPSSLISSWPTSMESARAQLEYECEMTCLVFSLAIVRHPPVAASRSWTMIFDPLSWGSNVSWSPGAYSPLEFYRVEDNDGRLAMEWASILASVDDSRIRIAQRRILSALSHRSDPVDGFIDAVVAWENLFGSPQGELSFRISSAMASLLSNNVNERLELQGKIKTQYDRRSSVLHGGSELPPEAAAQERDRALGFVLDALRRLYREFPDLIKDKERARRIVMML